MSDPAKSLGPVWSSVHGEKVSLSPFADILSRFDKDYYPTLDIHPGWTNLILKLHQLLIFISPNYTIMQIKTKFGGLRYYAKFVPKDSDLTQETSKEIFDCLIRYYEYLSTITCETCGSWGSLASLNNLYYTSCEKHSDVPPKDWLKL
jgi:hypothetical protein